MAALKVKLRMHPGDRAVYRDAELTLNGDYLSLAYLTREGCHAENAVVVLLPRERAVSTATKRGVYYVMVDSSTKSLKIKSPSIESQQHWASALLVNRRQTQPEDDDIKVPQASQSPSISIKWPSDGVTTAPTAHISREQSCRGNMNPSVANEGSSEANPDLMMKPGHRRLSRSSQSSVRHFQPLPMPLPRRQYDFSATTPTIRITTEDNEDGALPPQPLPQPRLSATSQASEPTPSVSPRVSATGPFIAPDSSSLHLEGARQ